MTSAASSQTDTTRILWIRHGETAWNTEKRFQGHLDIPLNETGHRQAQRLAVRMAALQTGLLTGKDESDDPLSAFVQGSPVSHLYASDLSRAAATAGYIAKATGLQLHTLPGLRERNYGQLAGLTSDEMARQHPDTHAGMVRRDPQAALPDGESLQQFYDRIIRHATELSDRHPGQTLAVVVHGGVLDCIYRHSKGIELSLPRQWLLANVSVNCVDHGRSAWTVKHWGDTRHLDSHAADEVDGRIV